jgi:cell division protein FtsI/penicillin-binding protein 2
MKKSRALQVGALFVLLGIGSLGVTYKMKKSQSSSSSSLGKGNVLTKGEVAEVLLNPASFYQFPSEADFSLSDRAKIRTKIQYTFDLKLQKVMENLFQSYGPDYGAFVAVDAVTGRILSMVSYSRTRKNSDNLALRATFPSASVFKVVTAAAAIEAHKISANTVIPFNGRNHTLYRGQILKSNITRWTRFITLKEAFARSVNTVFGKIGAYTVGSDGMRMYADRFGFNRKIAADLPVQEGRAPIPDDAWGLAETASGFTRENTMSPLQGALIAASVVNDGVMMEPYAVESVSRSDGALLYTATPKVATVTMDPATASEIRSLMKETVLHGTSRGSFRGFFRKDFMDFDVGGKTGSLTGFDPKGKYDWFVGYAHSSGRKIAVAALTIHEKQWRVKSSYLARRAIESYFKESVHHPKTIVKR